MGMAFFELAYLIGLRVNIFKASVNKGWQYLGIAVEHNQV